MSNVSKITVDDIEYYLADDLFEHYKLFFRGCINSRAIIKKKKISEDDYIFIKYNKTTNEYIVSDGKSRKCDKLYLSQNYVESNVPELSNNDEVKYEYEYAPEILELKDDEKFHDNEGNIYDIETRGVRDCDGIYFRVSDVSVAFDIQYLSNSLIDKDRDGYIEKEHYIYFILSEMSTAQKTINKKVLFLTYEGILRVLFVSKNNKTKPFNKWATKILFAVHMGSEEHKDELISDIKHIPAKTIKAIFNKSASTTPCIYLFKLGNVKELRQSMNISTEIQDDYMICKYGYTDDLKRRTGEHSATFKKIKKTNLELLIYSNIDVLRLSEAESFIGNVLHPYFFNYENYEELIVINNSCLEKIMEIYKKIVELYGGRSKDLLNQIKDMKIEHQLELMEQRIKYEREHNIQINIIKDECNERINVMNNSFAKQIEHCINVTKEKYKNKNTILKKLLFSSEHSNIQYQQKISALERDVHYLNIFSKNPDRHIDII